LRIAGLVSPALQEIRRKRMHTRPQTVTIAAILLLLLMLFNFPWPYDFLFPGASEAPAFITYPGYVVGIVGIVAAVGLWMLKPWSYWTTIVVCVLNFLLGAPGVIFAPGAALKAVIAVTEIVAVLVIVLVMHPTSRRALAAAERPSRVR
jgi:hypothetical protein